jgi:hypothetical protein
MTPERRVSNMREPRRFHYERHSHASTGRRRDVDHLEGIAIADMLNQKNASLLSEGPQGKTGELLIHSATMAF